MPTTLLTGANGFLAAHILDRLISSGHHVIGQVRSASKGDQILATHPEYAGHVDFVVVPDYTTEGCWDIVFRENDIDYVIHTAAPLLDDPGNTEFERDFLRPSVRG
jgi:nucleoside-diphosphate-sugar epimerase